MNAVDGKKQNWTLFVGEVKDPDFLNDLIDEQRGDILLATLDASWPYPAYSTLMTALLIRIERTLGSDRHEMKPHKHINIPPIFRDESQVDAFMRFMNSWILGWQSNVEERKGRIDPDTYVIEHNRAHRHMLEVEQGQEILTDLGKYILAIRGRGQDYPPYFVWPITNMFENITWWTDNEKYLKLMRSWPIRILAFVSEELFALYSEDGSAVYDALRRKDFINAIPSMAPLSERFTSINSRSFLQSIQDYFVILKPEKH